MRKRQQHQHGFTLVELIIVMSIFGILVGLATVNMGGTQRRITLRSITKTLHADIYQQQTKSMIGDTEGRTSADVYGVRFETDRYILFHGLTYDPADPANLSLELPNGIQFSNVTLPNSEIIFTRKGLVNNFSSGQNSITIQYASGNATTISFNKYGVATISP